ncbi:MAG: hypothetical protein BZY88_00245 [SAR202 cluster bacterium Io17-Chloro-G9]|nr:MAG: hypothetical protein BZY88_00245 [SAR202 cluster bacterium Io17-Chloro-G9]
MNRLASLWRLAGNVYVSGVLLAAVGVLVGYLAFFQVFPGKPKIGIIDIPFTVITDNSAFAIGAHLDYVSRDDSIKAVIIRLTSPGGGAAPSENLFFETRSIREHKPVVMVLNELVASGGYMISLGANYSFVKPSSFIGNIGVIVSPIPPVVAPAPTERDVFTGPFKLDGGSRRDYMRLTDQLKQAFAQLVITERGDRLNLTHEDLLSGRIYSGVESVRLGLTDAVGGDTDAIEKAASLAGISNYELVDVNTEVSRIFNEKRSRIREPLDRGAGFPDAADLITLLNSLNTGEDSGESPGSLEGSIELLLGQALDRPLLSRASRQNQEDALPGFPLKINGPNVYYL